MKFDIRERAKKFAIRIVKLVKKFPRDISGHELGKQLIRSGTSIGANLEEADAASSRKDFLHKVSISYKEAKETRYWLEVILNSELFNHQSNIKEAESLHQEAEELCKILFSIINPKKKN
jgi:four helix bundle protein